MGGITSGTGLFSGINTRQIIDSLMAIESRPKQLIQRRVLQLKGTQGGLLDINARLNALQTASANLRTNKSFQLMRAASSDTDVMSATASNTAQPGSYQFIVDRLVSSQQMLSRGFADKNRTALGATQFTLETADARLDRDTALSDLNGGEGIARGRIVINQGSQSATIDLSKAATVNDVLTAINSATGVDVSARVQDGRLVIRGNGGNITIANAAGSTTATSLGIAASTATAEVQGQNIYTLGDRTSINLLNDGLGLSINNSTSVGSFDFTVTVAGGTAVRVNLGDIFENPPPGGGTTPVKTASRVSDVGGVLKRINDALSAAGITDVKAEINSDGTGLNVRDLSGQNRAITVAENAQGKAAATLGIVGTANGTLQGKRVLAGLNSTLAANLNGGAGVGGDGTINITGRNGQSYSVNVNTGDSLERILREFSADTGGAITASLDERGTGIVITDTTGGSGNLIISGATAESLKINTAPAGVAAASVRSGNLQFRYVSDTTRLSTLNGGRGIGTGVFRLTDSTGAVATVDIGDDSVTLDDVIKEINSRGTRVRARINANGDGLEIFEQIPEGGTAGNQKIKIEDTTGSVAKSLNIAGEAAGTAAQNKINGSFERTVKFEATDTLERITQKINGAGVGVTASIVADGTSSASFRLNITSTSTGSRGRFILDTGAVDLGLRTLDTGSDARVFFGSSDPASAILVTSSTNTLDNIVDGVKIDLKTTNTSPVTLTVSRDTGGVESAVKLFVDSFNTAIERINFQTRYDDETKARGTLLGDSTALALRNALYSVVQGRAQGISGRYDQLSDIGITIGSGGRLQLDSTAFRAALNDDPAAVEALFTARVVRENNGDLGNGVRVVDPNRREEFSRLGITASIEELAKRYLDNVDGILTVKNRSIDDQVRSQEGRITALDARLEVRRTVLEKQFAAMEQSIARLQSQGSSLSSIPRFNFG